MSEATVPGHEMCSMPTLVIPAKAGFRIIPSPSVGLWERIRARASLDRVRPPGLSSREPLKQLKQPHPGPVKG